jgi:CheY-like chemotaxis protein
VNLKDITGAMLREAVAIYMEEAYGGLPPRRRPPDLHGAARVEDALALMDDEGLRRGGAQPMRRWVLRLGNSRYPNMKLVLEEYLLAGEFVLAVDTHDDAVVLAGDPDEPAWKELRNWNLSLKRRIEARWKNAGLPTYAALREVLRRSARPNRGPSRGTVLVVDDEPDIADTVAAVLTAEGYRVRKAADGAEAVEILETLRPDLILMDYEMPRMNGTEVCARIRRDRRDRDIPILLATAAMVDLSALADADGFLVKPYQRDVLLSFVSHLAAKGVAGRAGRSAARKRKAKGAAPPASRPAFRRGARRGPLVSSDRPPPAPAGARPGRRTADGGAADAAAGDAADEEE